MALLLFHSCVLHGQFCADIYNYSCSYIARAVFVELLGRSLLINANTSLLPPSFATEPVGLRMNVQQPWV